MSKLINEFPQHFLSTGAPAAFYNVFFGEPNVDPKLNPKVVYSDKALSVSLGSQLALDASGSYGIDVFLSGTYSVRIETPSGSLWRESDEIFGLEEISGTTSFQRSQEGLRLGSEVVNGVLTPNDISVVPGVNSLDVVKNGATLRFGTDYTIPSATTISFLFDVFAADEFNIQTFDSVEITTADSANITYTPAGTGAVPTNVQTQLRLQFWADNFASIQDAVNAAETLGGGIVNVGAGTNQLTETLVVPHTVGVRGVGRTTTILQAAPSFTGTYLVQLGTTAASFYNFLEDLKLDLSLNEAIGGVYSNRINEMSGLRRVLVTDSLVDSVHIEHAGANQAQNYFLDDIEVFVSASATGATIGVNLIGNFADNRGLDNITVTSRGGGSTPAIAIRLEEMTGLFSRVHVEHVATGVQVVNSGACHFINVTGESDITDVINFDATSKNYTVTALQKGGATNAINDQRESITLTGNVDFYSVSDGTAGTTTPRIVMAAMNESELKVNKVDLRGTTPHYEVNGTQVVGVQGAAVGDPFGGATIDSECRTQLSALLAELRASTGHGIIGG
jgi:hypothetical protein